MRKGTKIIAGKQCKNAVKLVRHHAFYYLGAMLCKWYKKALLLIVLLIYGIAGSAAVFVVTTNANSGSGSLRQAIIDAGSNTPGTTDEIIFRIPASDAAAVTIELTAALPVLSDHLIIDGTTQGTTFLDSRFICIQLVNKSGTFINGLVVDKVSDVQIYGIHFVNFNADINAGVSDKRGAIYLKDAKNIIIGNRDKQNAFTNNYAGVYAPLDPHLLENIKIQSNYFGLLPDGTGIEANRNGIDISYIRNSVVGGEDAGLGNFFAANEGFAIYVSGMSGNMEISFNKVGFDVKHKLIPSAGAKGISANGRQATLYMDNNWVGGQAVGIYIGDVDNGFFLKRNRIGTGINGNENYGNSETGIEIYHCDKGTIGTADWVDRNDVAYNRNGILINESYPITVTKNSIYCNTGKPLDFKNVDISKLQTPRVTEITAGTAKGNYFANSIIELFYDDECPDCQGKTFLAAVNTLADGSWSYQGAINGAITVTGTNSDGATSGFTSPVLNDRQIQIVNEQCGMKNGSIRNIEVSDATEFHWFDANNAEVAQTKDLLNVKAGKYYLIAGQKGGCSVTSDIYEIKSINYAYKVKLAALTASACGKTNGSVIIQSFETDVPQLFEWLDKDDKVVSTERNLVNVPPGTYRLFGDNGSGCRELTGTFTIEYTEDLVVNTGKVQIINNDCLKDEGTISNVRIVGGTAPFTYQWLDENGQQAGAQADLIQAPSGKYMLKITDAKGCSVQSDYITIPPSLVNAKIPNSFSPNGDGVNDVWRIPGLSGLPDFEVKIFNRQGNLVFHAKNEVKNFDGRFNNNDLPVGVYYYYINLKNNCKSLHGSLTLIR